MCFGSKHTLSILGTHRLPISVMMRCQELWETYFNPQFSRSVLKLLEHCSKLHLCVSSKLLLEYV